MATFRAVGLDRSMRERRRVWVEVATPQQVVEVGLRTILETAQARLDITTDGPLGGEPDVVLFDVIHLRDGDTTDLDRWVKETATTVIAIDRTLKPELGVQAREKGVEWGITLAITAAELVQLIDEAVSGTLDASDIAQEWDPGDYLGQEAGLSPREAEILGLIVAGRSNQQIAEGLYLSINSVKTHIRSAYAKVQVTNRAQAVAWGLQHGFPADPDVGSPSRG